MPGNTIRIKRAMAKAVNKIRPRHNIEAVAAAAAASEETKGTKKSKAKKAE